MKIYFAIVSLAVFGTLSVTSCNTNKKEEPLAKDSVITTTRHHDPIQDEMPNSMRGADTIVIKDMKFIPAILETKKGHTVVWINEDIVVHDASKFPDKEWTSGPLKNGDSWSKKITGSFNYFCSIHETMQGKVIVR